MRKRIVNVAVDSAKQISQRAGLAALAAGGAVQEAIRGGPGALKRLIHVEQ